jgi:hypothetical protein
MSKYRQNAIELRIRQYVFLIALGLCITLIGGFLSILSARGGHGDYFFAKLFFPYGMIIASISRHTISILSILLSLAQFPIYCVVTAVFGVDKKKMITVISFLILCHVSAFSMCFIFFRF